MGPTGCHSWAVGGIWQFLYSRTRFAARSIGLAHGTNCLSYVCRLRREGGARPGQVQPRRWPNRKERDASRRLAESDLPPAHQSAHPHTAPAHFTRLRVRRCAVHTSARSQLGRGRRQCRHRTQRSSRRYRARSIMLLFLSNPKCRACVVVLTQPFEGEGEGAAGPHSIE